MNQNNIKKIFWLIYKLNTKHLLSYNHKKPFVLFVCVCFLVISHTRVKAKSSKSKLLSKLNINLSIQWGYRSKKTAENYILFYFLITPSLDDQTLHGHICTINSYNHCILNNHTYLWMLITQETVHLFFVSGR